MTENEVNITDMIKALQCVASQDADGDCYCDHFNAHLTCEQFGDNTRLDEKHMSCGGVLKDTQSCPYSQKTYGVCYEDGELWWLKDVVSILTEIQQYRAIGTVEEFKALKVENEELHCEIQAINATMDLLENEIRAEAIDEFVEKLSLEVSESIIWDMLATMSKNSSLSDTSDEIVDYVIDTSKKIADQMKAGGIDG